MTVVGQIVDENPIINAPYEEPSRHWNFGGERPIVVAGRRPSGFLPPSPDGQLRIIDIFNEIPVVNDLRNRVRTWRNDGYIGASNITKDLFSGWFDDGRIASSVRPFFCQQEAIETLVFLTEGPADRLVGVDVPSAGELYSRLAVKMATGTGKTLVMAMTIVWSGLNRAANRRDPRFTDQVLVVCPNLTVRDRLTGAGGLLPENPESLYNQFDLIPPNLSTLFGQVRVEVVNWHQLFTKDDPKRSVMRRGPESPVAFCRRVLTGLSSRGRILVINDEAHHAWRVPADLILARDDEDAVKEATVWIEGLEMVHRHRGILRCLDFSATPMYPGSFRSKAWSPFEWIVSDFALVDAIESGLVKIPRTPTDDNAGAAVPKYRNLWTHIKGQLPKRKDLEGGSNSLTDYLTEADGPLKQLAGEWDETLQAWSEAGRREPPVMIVVCHDTTMARILERHIAELGEAGPELQNHPGQPPVTVRIDTDALARAESGEGTATAEATRKLVATVGKRGQPGEQVRCLVSVAMLSEGWDARNVTHILGLRAFQSQLLCEQVVGRGLRRTDYSDLSKPEYVDVYGVPFQLLPVAQGSAGGPVLPPDYESVHTMADRPAYRLQFPRVVQIVPDVQDRLIIDWEAIQPVRVEPRFDPTDTWVEFDLGGSGHGIGGETQNRHRAYESFRIQRLCYRLAARLIAPYPDRPWLFPQALRIAHRATQTTEEGGKIALAPGVDERELCNLRYLSLLHDRLSMAIKSEPEGETDDGDERLVPALDDYQPIGSTDGMNYYAPREKCLRTAHSHISHAVCDSALEMQIATVLDSLEQVDFWVKNHKLFFEIPYLYQGQTHRYRPDFLVRTVGGVNLLIEGKGQADEKDDAKFTAARRWCVAVNTWGRLGQWSYEVCYDVKMIEGILELSALTHSSSLF